MLPDIKIEDSQAKNKPLTWSIYISDKLRAVSNQLGTTKNSSPIVKEPQTWKQYLSSYQTSIINYLWSPIAVFKEAHKAISPLIGNSDLLGAVIFEVAAVMAINYVQLQASVALSQNKREMDALLLNDSPNDNMYDQMYNIVTGPYMIHAITASVASLATDFVTREVEVYLKKIALPAHMHQLYNKNGTFLRVSENDIMNRNLKLIPKDLGLIIRVTTGFVASFSVASVNGGTALYHLLLKPKGIDLAKVSVPGLYMIGFKVASSVFGNVVSDQLSNQYTQNCKDAGKHRGNLQIIEHNDQDNALAIAAMNAENTVVSKFNTASDKLFSIEKRGARLQTVMQFWNTLYHLADTSLDYMLVAHSSSFIPMSPKEISANAHYLSSLSTALSWKSTNSRNTAELTDSAERVNALDAIKKSPTSEKIVRTFQGEKTKPVIHIANALIKRQSDEKQWRTILQCDAKKQLVIELQDKFEKASRFGIVGSAGSGKSTFFQMLKGLQENSLTTKVTGTICFPKDFKPSNSILYIAQKLYIPKSVTLLELIAWPTPKDKITPDFALKCLKKSHLFIEALGLETTDVFSAYLEEAMTLETAIENGKNNDSNFHLSDLGPDIAGFHVEKNWESLGFSGGQLKVFPLIWALCQEPKLLLLDETLNGMDAKLIDATREHLHETLTKTSIGEIYHFAEGVDINNIYDQVVNLDIFNTVALKRSQSTSAVSLSRSPSRATRTTSVPNTPGGLFIEANQEVINDSESILPQKGHWQRTIPQTSYQAPPPPKGSWVDSSTGVKGAIDPLQQQQL